ncbi:mechanosensitive ion channel family protein [Neptuniibacter halophilus]|uniref:mechanosensitive ion channel family protein n=1 Tax=Neptuniibacter halophilus TaxID=651666 RepID=UPI0025727026|nr:mechanosensitive ion channel domain-containing protein [Neptuniibacter halophilus]
MLTMETLQTSLLKVLKDTGELLSASETYIQFGNIIAIYIFAYLIANQVKQKFIWVNTSPGADSHPMRKLVYGIHRLLFPLLAIIALKFFYEIYGNTQYANWLLQFALGIAMMLFLNQLIQRFVLNQLLAKLFQWIALPLLFLHLIGWLIPITQVLEQIRMELGNFSISAYGLARVFIFGIFLFWFGRASNHFGQDVIRKHPNLDIPTKEVMAKLLEVALFTIVVLVLLNVMGINLTALAVFGGALGVGLGLGLQSIASNFISGIIILLDRSITIDDYIEFDDGSKGYVREFRMRYTTLETFDGKFVMVPNEKFISNSFINWSHKDLKQRFRVDFSVAYKTDIRALCDIIREVVAQHPQVISGDDIPIEERPDCEIDSFGDSGVNMFVEFWMNGIDDGKNRVGGDLLLTIFETLREHDIEIPFPQREVRVLNPESVGAKTD